MSASAADRPLLLVVARAKTLHCIERVDIKGLATWPNVSLRTRSLREGSFVVAEAKRGSSVHLDLLGNDEPSGIRIGMKHNVGVHGKALIRSQVQDTLLVG